MNRFVALRNQRGIMQHMLLAGGVAVSLAVAVVAMQVPPTLLPPEPPGPIVVGPKGSVVAGDTLVYTVSWGAGARATSYDFTRSVAGSNGAWSIVADSQSGNAKNVAAPGAVPLPNTFSYIRPVLSHRMWLTAVPWDSATFTVTIISRNASGTSAPVAATWKVSRKPGPPGPIVVDSSLTVVGLLMRPPTLALTTGQQRWVCAYPQFGDGAVASPTASRGNCDSLRVALWKLPTAAQQAHADSLCITFASSNLAVFTVTSVTCPLGMRPDLIWRVALQAERFVGVPGS